MVAILKKLFSEQNYDTYDDNTQTQEMWFTLASSYSYPPPSQHYQFTGVHQHDQHTGGPQPPPLEDYSTQYPS
ncbi:hypothetical protein HYDPIDRAFT_33738 [Hydnomerulius pinastri MD-312]|uniref:Uncharacterized protein n=1 Tax=Hydnomerulius pinastri MD-312 TaxID=994086 RepID=A0A0C9W7L1_9AGAM|nr:hypothetical protein HYDPIDRAFT_33738 [Hydnomerulius pinastri MD-312]